MVVYLGFLQPAGQFQMQHTLPRPAVDTFILECSMENRVFNRKLLHYTENRIFLSNTLNSIENHVF